MVLGKLNTLIQCLWQNLICWWSFPPYTRTYDKLYKWSGNSSNSKQVHIDDASVSDIATGWHAPPHWASLMSHYHPTGAKWNYLHKSNSANNRPHYPMHDVCKGHIFSSLRCHHRRHCCHHHCCHRHRHCCCCCHPITFPSVDYFSKTTSQILFTVNFLNHTWPPCTRGDCLIQLLNGRSAAWPLLSGWSVRRHISAAQT